MRESLEELIGRIIREVGEGKQDPRIETYINYKSKYVVLKPSAKVEIELTDGRVLKIDVSDYFEGEIK